MHAFIITAINKLFPDIWHFINFSKYIKIYNNTYFGFHM